MDRVIAGVSDLPLKVYPRIEDFARAHGISRSKTYEEIAAGRLRPVKVGKRTLIPVTEAERWLASLAGGEAS
jgi:excisionase family DNA binding protein